MPASAQDRFQVVRGERFRLASSESARVLGTVSEGAELVGMEERDGFRQVTLQGWIWGRSVARTERGAFDLAVSASSGENLRATANGRVIARLANGFLLEEVARDGNWVHVRRSGWVASAGLRAVGVAAVSALFTGLAVGVDVAKGDAVFSPEPRQRVVVGEIVAVVVGDGNSDDLAFTIVSSTTVTSFDPVAKEVVDAAVYTTPGFFLPQVVVDGNGHLLIAERGDFDGQGAGLVILDIDDGFAAQGPLDVGGPPNAIVVLDAAIGE